MCKVKSTHRLRDRDPRHLTSVQRQSAAHRGVKCQARLTTAAPRSNHCGHKAPGSAKSHRLHAARHPRESCRGGWSCDPSALLWQTALRPRSPQPAGRTNQGAGPDRPRQLPPKKRPCRRRHPAPLSPRENRPSAMCLRQPSPDCRPSGRSRWRLPRDQSRRLRQKHKARSVPVQFADHRAETPPGRPDRRKVRGDGAP